MALTANSFQREAKVLASLNHPNIAAIYGIEESEGTRALVLELVEGKDRPWLTGRDDGDRQHLVLASHTGRTLQGASNSH